MKKPKCWNCDSDRYFETASLEECPDCGIRCDYHGAGANAIYNEAMKFKQAEERAAEEKRLFENYY